MISEDFNSNSSSHNNLSSFYSDHLASYYSTFDDLLSISPSLQEPFNEYNFYLPLSPSFSTSANEILNENSLSKQSNSWVLI